MPTSTRQKMTVNSNTNYSDTFSKSVPARLRSAYPGSPMHTAAAADKITDEETQNIIEKVNKEYQFILDPHTATGFGAAKKINTLEDIIVLGTAHPFKFHDTIKRVTGKSLEAPEHLKMYIDKKEKFDIIGNSNLEVKNYILKKIK